MSQNMISVPFQSVNRIRQLASAAYLNRPEPRATVDNWIKALGSGGDPVYLTAKIENLLSILEVDWRRESSRRNAAKTVAKGKKKGGNRHPQTAA